VILLVLLLVLQGASE